MTINRPPGLALALLLAFVSLAASAGCAAAYKRNPLPPELSDGAVVPGIPGARFWGDEDTVSSPTGQRRLAELVAQATSSGLIDEPSNWLVLSGGGANGAFAAGLLAGWSDRGDRPEFNRVTGVSTGALIAPFAFLGPDYDHVLEEVYTTVETSDIVSRRSIIAALSSDALTSTRPLQDLLAFYVTPELISAIAEQHQRGRRLLVITTNLDALRPVVWDIGEIAASDTRGRVELVRKILLASASIPIAMPPVYIEVEAAGAMYDEMHVDGGATAQLFLYSSGVDAEQAIADLGVDAPTIYIIRNARLAPPWETVRPKITSIARRTLASLVRTQGLGDLYQAYLLSQRDGIAFRLAVIPDSSTEQPAEPFDTEYMIALFERARAAGRQGFRWAEAPPGYDPGDD